MKKKKGAIRGTTVTKAVGHGKTQVLAVEDDFLVSREIARAVEAAGFNIIGTASNGKEAVEMARSLKPDVIIMDIKMPGLDGIQAAGQIQESTPTPIVVLTAYESHHLLERASQSGVGAYLIKPPKPAEIERAVTIAMARHNDLLELRCLNKKINSQKEELKKAIGEIKTLRGIVPICAKCKKIRDDKGYWELVEVYVSDRTEAKFSHSLCPLCAKELYPHLKLDLE